MPVCAATRGRKVDSSPNRMAVSRTHDGAASYPDALSLWAS
jgi:hypothetical protein